MKRKLSPRALYVVVGAGLLAYAMVGWFVLVSPKRADAASLTAQVATAENALSTARVAAAGKDDAQPIAVADIFRLATAMPSVPDMPGILLELSRIAQESGIEFNSITPQASEAQGAFQTVPIALTFDGNFYELSDFLFRLRTLVGVRDSELRATGRLFSIQMLEFAESAQSFPEITATLIVNAYVYGTATPANEVPGAVAGDPAAGAPTAPPAAPSGAEAAPAGATP